MKLQDAAFSALDIQRQLLPHCEKVKVGGSIRRQASFVKDIEIICVPKMRTPKMRSREWINTVWNLGDISKGKIGHGKYIRIKRPSGIMIDLFVADPKNFAMIYLIRTGSAEFVRGILGRFNSLGYTSKGGILKNKLGEELYFQTEEQIFEYLGMQYVQPKNRG